MKSRAIAAVVALSCATAVAASTAGAATPTAGAASCEHATIHGKKVCLAQGQTCQYRYRAQYPKYGFACVNEHGKYRLVSEGQ